MAAAFPLVVSLTTSPPAIAYHGYTGSFLQFDLNIPVLCSSGKGWGAAHLHLYSLLGIPFPGSPSYLALFLP